MVNGCFVRVAERYQDERFIGKTYGVNAAGFDVVQRHNCAETPEDLASKLYDAAIGKFQNEPDEFIRVQGSVVSIIRSLSNDDMEDLSRKYASLVAEEKDDKKEMERRDKNNTVGHYELDQRDHLYTIDVGLSFHDGCEDEARIDYSCLGPRGPLGGGEYIKDLARVLNEQDVKIFVNGTKEPQFHVGGDRVFMVSGLDYGELQQLAIDMSKLLNE